MGLHHGMGLDRRRIGNVDLDGGRSEGGFGVARSSVGRAVAPRLRHEGLVLGARQLDDDRIRRIADENRRGCGSRLLEGLGHDDRDGLPVMVDAIVDQFGADLLAFLALFRSVAIGDDRDHTGHALG